MTASRQNAMQGVCNRIAGSLTAGAVLFRANYWMPKASIDVFDDGRIWIAKRADQWCQETGLTIDTYRRAVTRLRRDGLIETTQTYFGRQRITHLRLTNKAMDLIRSGVATASTSASARPSHGQDGEQGSAPSAPVPGRNAQPFDTPERAPQLRKSAHLYKKREENEKRSEDKESGSRSDTAFDPEGSEQGFRGKRDSIEEIWIHEIEKQFARYASLTAGNRKQLKQFAQRCPNAMAEAILIDTVCNWQGFTLAAKTDAGAFNLPRVPQVEFLLKFTDVAINLSLRRLATAEQRIEDERSTLAAQIERQASVERAIAGEHERVEAEARLKLACKEIVLTEAEEDERLLWCPEDMYVPAPPSFLLLMSDDEELSWSKVPEYTRNDPSEIAHRELFIRHVIAPRRGIA